MEPKSRAAERQKKYRERLKALQPEKYEAAKKRNAERMNRNRKKIADCSNEEKESLRKSWRDQKKKTAKKEDAKCEKENPFMEEEEKVQNKTKTGKEIILNIKNNGTKDNGTVPSLFKLAYSKCILHFEPDFKQNTAISKTSCEENILLQQHSNCVDGDKTKSRSTEEIEDLRKKWREYKRRQKEKQNEYENQLEKWKEYKRKTKDEKEDIKLKIMSENKKLKNENFQLKTEVIFMKKKLKKFSQKLKRMQKKNEELIEKVNKIKNENYVDSASTNPTDINDMTPITKSVDVFMNENLPTISVVDKDKVKRKLTEYNVFIDSIKSGYQHAKDLESKQRIKSLIIDNEKVKQYKLKTKLAGFIGLKGKIRHTLKKKKNSLLQDDLTKFYERDDVSRATAGKNEVKVQKKNKKQRRYLLNSLKNLYKKYKSEGGLLSYSTFKKYRPFYVLSPKTNSRNTCACIKHENLSLKLKVLRSMKMIETQSLDGLLSMVVCDLRSKECAYGECEVCKNKKIEFHNFMPDETVSWHEWITKAHEYKEKNSEDTKTTKKVIKEKKTAPLKNFIYAFSQELEQFKKHAYHIIHQYREYRRCINNLDDHSVVFHIDYSENYGCKLGTEIQSMHFGASRQQITLHTGVMYLKGKKPVTFCSLSNNNYHGPEAIWAHMSPVLEFVKNEYPTITKAHFCSDGPTTQYRQKKNFHYFSVYMKKYGFTTSTWNFSEASHGKGAADGVGGAIKRKLDSFVNCGLDVVNADIAFQLLAESDTTVKVFLIPEDTIQMLTIELLTIPGTMKIHQIINTNNDEIFYRSLSCFCYLESSENSYCKCFDLKKMCLQKPEPKTREENRKYVTVLSDIKNTEQNRKYFDLKDFDPFNTTKVRMDDILNPKITQKVKPKKIKRKLELLNEVVKPKKPKIDDDSSTENDDDYSLQDSSEDEIFIPQVETTEEDDNRTATQPNVPKENEILSIQENVEFLDEDLLSQDDNLNTLDENDTINVSDCILVRYYKRNNWKYYIGFVESITTKEEANNYLISFLKMVKKPSLKFVLPKKKDYDSVPLVSIVKKIDLVQNEHCPKEYLLKYSSDDIYFNN